MNLYTMSIQLGLLEERVKSLEKENEEIKRKINEKEYQAHGTYYDVELPIKQYAMFEAYDLDSMVN